MFKKLAAKRVVRTFTALLFGTGQEFLFQLLSAILWIRFWGKDYYSEWIFLSLMPTLLVRSNTGLFHSATSELIQSYNANQLQVVSQTMRALFWATIAFVSLIAIAWIGSVFWIVVSQQLVVFGTAEIVAAAVLYYLQFCLFEYLQTDLSLMKAVGRFPESVQWQNAYRAVGIIGLLAPAAFFRAIPCLSLAVAGQFVIVMLVIWRCRPLRLNLPTSTYEPWETWRLLRRGMEFSTFPFGQSILHSVSVWAIGWHFGTVTGAAYHNMRTLSRTLLLLARTTEQSVRYELSESIAKQQIDKAVRLQRRLFLTNGGLCLAAFLFLLVIGKTAFNFLVNGELEFDWYIYVALCLGSLASALSLSFLAIPFSINRQGRHAIAYFIMVMLGVALSLTAAYWGAWHVAIAGLVIEIAVLLCFAYLGRRTIELARNHQYG